jgi:predicted RNA-binding protein with EMAP domain
MDTAKDARVLVLEDALRRLNEVVSNRKLKIHIEYSKLDTLLKTAGSLLYEVKYSYLESSAVADTESMTKIIDQVGEFGEIYQAALGNANFHPSSAKEGMMLSEIDYALRIVDGIKRRLKEHDEDPGFAIDILAVELTDVTTVEGSQNLSECRCSDGTRIWKILTNIQGVKKGMKLPCAVLPPAEMMGKVSEAMFLGGNELPPETPLGLLSNPPESALDQARAQVREITKRMM